MYTLYADAVDAVHSTCDNLLVPVNMRVTCESFLLFFDMHTMWSDQHPKIQSSKKQTNERTNKQRNKETKAHQPLGISWNSSKNVSTMFDNHYTLLLFWLWNKQTFCTLLLRDLRYMVCSRDLDVLRPQRIMGLFVLISHKSMWSESMITWYTLRMASHAPKSYYSPKSHTFAIGMSSLCLADKLLQCRRSIAAFLNFGILKA